MRSVLPFPGRPTRRGRGICRGGRNAHTLKRKERRFQKKSRAPLELCVCVCVCVCVQREEAEMTCICGRDFSSWVLGMGGRGGRKGLVLKSLACRTLSVQERKGDPIRSACQVLRTWPSRSGRSFEKTDGSHVSRQMFDCGACPVGQSRYLLSHRAGTRCLRYSVIGTSNYLLLCAVPILSCC